MKRTAIKDIPAEKPQKPALSNIDKQIKLLEMVDGDTISVSTTSDYFLYI